MDWLNGMMIERMRMCIFFSSIMNHTNQFGKSFKLKSIAMMNFQKFTILLSGTFAMFKSNYEKREEKIQTKFGKEKYRNERLNHQLH